MPIYLDTDPLSGAVETFDYDHGTDTAIIRRTCDVQPIIDRNKELANHTEGWASREKDMRLAASIPLEVALVWKQRYGVEAWRKEHWPFVKRLLNDPEWRYLRTNNSVL